MNDERTVTQIINNLAVREFGFFTFVLFFRNWWLGDDDEQKGRQHYNSAGGCCGTRWRDDVATLNLEDFDTNLMHLGGECVGWWSSRLAITDTGCRNSIVHPSKSSQQVEVKCWRKRNQVWTLIRVNIFQPWNSPRWIQ